MNYRSGEEIKKGDHVLFHGNAAEVEFIADHSNIATPETVWHIEQWRRSDDY